MSNRPRYLFREKNFGSAFMREKTLNAAIHRHPASKPGPPYVVCTATQYTIYCATVYSVYVRTCTLYVVALYIVYCMCIIYYILHNYILYALYIHYTIYSYATHIYKSVVFACVCCINSFIYMFAHFSTVLHSFVQVCCKSNYLLHTIYYIHYFNSMLYICA